MKRTWSRPVVCALAVCALFTGVQDLRAEARLGPGCFIRSTPFYQKLLSAGVFDIPLGRPADPQPVQLLFRMARSIHYASDRSRRDRWQSADETSRYFSGDCEDKAIWLYTQMRRNGRDDAALHIGKYTPSSRKFHMWVTLEDGSGRTLLLDPTIQRKPWDAEAFPKRNYKSMHVIKGDDCVSIIPLD